MGDKVTYESRGKAMGTIMGAMIGSTVIGVPIGAFLSEIGNWQWTFYSIGLLTLFLTLLINHILRNEKERGCACFFNGNGGCTIENDCSKYISFICIISNFSMDNWITRHVFIHRCLLWDNFGLSVGKIGIVIFWRELVV